MRLSTKRVSAIAACALLAIGALAFPAIGGPESKAKWTIALYMSSARDLDSWGEYSTELLMSAPTSDQVNIVAFWDRTPGPAELYKISKKTMTPLTNFEYCGVEVNMGDPTVLEAYVDYINTEFPATYVMLVLWNHGDDLRGICYDYDTGTDAAFDILSHMEIGDALSGKHVDIIAADGCGIGIIESSYEYVLRGVTAEWFVANENYVPLQGFPYDEIAKDLVANPSMSPEQLSQVTVMRYEEYYQGGWLTELTAIRLSAIATVVDELWDVTSILTKDMKTYRGLIGSSKGHARMGWSQYGWEEFVDFPTVFQDIYAGAPEGSKLKVQTGQLLEAIEAAVPYIGMSSPGYVWDFGGIGVFFPSSASSMLSNWNLYGYLYPELSFSQDGWMSFLMAFWGK
jgi:hypothetical protein